MNRAVAKRNSSRFITYTACTVALCLPLGFAGAAYADSNNARPASDSQTTPQLKNSVQNWMSGIPSSLLAQQSKARVVMTRKDDAIKVALQAAKETAVPLVDTAYHRNGKTFRVPGNCPTIQAAINAASSGDVVVVEAGTYFELLVMKDGVKLVSDASDGGDELVSVEGATLKLPRRTLRTIIDGSKGKVSRHGVIDFDPGLGRNTILDGFTIQNLPKQDHHIPGHAHALNVRGASPVIVNCLIQNNGSTGIGSHVIFHDQGRPIRERDFRWANVKRRASAVIYDNIVRGNFGVGIGSNHFSNAFILGNEVMNNDDTELDAKPSPGIGSKHGSAPTIVGNIVHDNPGGGVGCSAGEPQGRYEIDRPTHPRFIKNVVFNSGSVRPGISCNNSGSADSPVEFIGNYVYDADRAGITFRDGTVGIIEGNMVSGSREAGIAVSASTVLKLNGNKVTGSRRGAGIAIVAGSVVKEMRGNASDSNRGLPFMIKRSTVGR